MELIQSFIFLVIMGVSGAIGAVVFVCTLIAYCYIALQLVVGTSRHLFRAIRLSTSSGLAISILCGILGFGYHSLVSIAHDYRAALDSQLPALASASLQMAEKSQYAYENVKEVKMVPASLAAAGSSKATLGMVDAVVAPVRK